MCIISSWGAIADQTGKKDTNRLKLRTSFQSWTHGFAVKNEHLLCHFIRQLLSTCVIPSSVRLTCEGYITLYVTNVTKSSLLFSM